MKPFVKICGTTTLVDAQIARDAGADFVGVILHPPSPRFVSNQQLHEIARIETPLVLVTVNLSFGELLELNAEWKPRALQLHGGETPELVQSLVDEGIPVWKVISGSDLKLPARMFSDAGAELLVVDAREETEQGTIYGGTGKCADWHAARALVDEGFKIVLAGGLDAENVARAVSVVRPLGVDVVSGVEARPGVKDAALVHAFVDEAHAC